MTKSRPIKYRAIHTKNRWRSTAHDSITNALGKERGAKALFDHKLGVDYAKHGEPLYVVVWDEREIGSGRIVRANQKGLDQAVISDKMISRFENGESPTNDELDLLFKLHPSSDVQDVPQQYAPPIGEPSPNVPLLETEDKIEKDLQARIHAARLFSVDKRGAEIATINSAPLRIQVTKFVHLRNANVIVEVLNRAAGFCQHCHSPAPFVRLSDSTPYLEVHHIIPLAAGGFDSVENAEALCPNCQRDKHFGHTR